MMKYRLINTAFKPMAALALCFCMGSAHAQNKGLEDVVRNPEQDKTLQSSGLSPIVNVSRVDPRSFFPRIVRSSGVKPIKPENPSRLVEIPVLGLDDGRGIGREIPPQRPPYLGGRITGMDRRGLNSNVFGQSNFGSGSQSSGFIESSNGSGAKLPDAVVFGDNISDPFVTPPDTSIATSGDYMVQVINVQVGFYQINRDADGAPESTTKLLQQPLTSNGFVQGIGPTPFAFDPRVIYDKEADKFIILILDLDNDNEKSYVLLGVSDTGNPMDSWTWNRLDTTFLDGDDNGYWLDYPSISVNDDYVVLSGNMFSFGDGTLGPFISFHVLDKPLLYNNIVPGNVNAFAFNDFQLFNARPARINGDSSEPLYSISFAGGEITGPTTSRSVFRIYATTKENNRPVLTSTDVQFFGDYFFGTPGLAPGPGQSFDTIGGRLMDASYSDGILATAHTLVASLTDRRAAAAFAEFDMQGWPLSGDQPQAYQFGKIVLPGAAHAYQPAIERSPRGDASMIFTRSANGEVPSVMVATRKKDDPLGQFGTPEVLFTGIQYQSPFDFGRRWGDYAGIQLDPTDDRRYFGFNHVANGAFGDGTVSGAWSIPGGVAQNNDAPSSVTMIFGTNTGGSITSFAASGDSDVFVVAPEEIQRRGMYAAYELSFGTSSAKADVERLSFNLTGFTSPKSLAGYMYLYNTETTRWDLIRTFRTSRDIATDVNFFVPERSQKYVSEDQTIKVRVMVFDPFRRRGGGKTTSTLPLTFQTDRAVMSINSFR